MYYYYRPSCITNNYFFLIFGFDIRVGADHGQEEMLNGHDKNDSNGYATMDVKGLFIVNSKWSIQGVSYGLFLLGTFFW